MCWCWWRCSESNFSITLRSLFLMKTKIIIWILILGLFEKLDGQCTFFECNNYQGASHHLTLGQSLTISLNIACSPSGKVSGNSALLIKWAEPAAGFPFVEAYSEENFAGIPGTSQYRGAKIIVQCIQKGSPPQPTAFIPVDRSHLHPGVYQEGPPLSLIPNHRMLVLRRAFFWENSEDFDCDADGGYGAPYGNLYIGKPGSQVYLPGPVFNAGGDCPWGSGPDAKSEWIDGPWGCCYSNCAIYDWTETGDNLVTIRLHEADDSNEDDILGSFVVNKNTTGEIFHLFSPVGFVVLENIDVPSSGFEPSVEVGNYYWFHNWNGVLPDVGEWRFEKKYDQYNPLAGKTIEEMEVIFPEKSTIGLLGGKFPKGKFSKPMIYKSPCQTAVFGN